MFITFEGPEGGGKTTVMAFLLERLLARGLSAISLREPGGTHVGEQVRRLLLDTRADIAPAAEMLLFSASRAQLVESIIRPHLAAGGVVVCDRYADSTLAYQGFGRGLDLTALRQITRFATSGLTPDLTLYFDIDPAQGIARREGSGSLNRMDAQTLEFHHRVRDGYLALMAAEPDRWVRVDASAPLAVVQGTVINVVGDRLAARGMI
jgi:dTMP kinase